MELEILAKVFASQVFKDLIDNIPSNIILLGLAGFIFVKYFIKWNNNRLQNKSSEIKKINSILENTNNLIEKVDKIEKVQEKTNAEVKELDKRILTIEIEAKANSKQESAVIAMLNRIINSIDKK